MTRILVNIGLIAAATVVLSGCGAAKLTGQAAALPFKAAYKTTELTGRGVVGTGMLAGKGIYHTGRLTGKGLYNTGKAVYYVGRVPVVITDQAMDTTNKVLTVTTRAVDLSGKVVEVSRNIQATELEAELEGVRGAANVLSVFVDVFRA